MKTKKIVPLKIKSFVVNSFATSNEMDTATCDGPYSPACATLGCTEVCHNQGNDNLLVGK